MKKYLICLFLILVLSKIILSFFIHSPQIVFDESGYTLQAHSIWFNHTYFIAGRIGCLDYPQYPFLYALLISPFASLPAETFFHSVLIFNCFISSLAIVPTFFLAKQYLSDNESFLISFLVGIMPSCFIYTFSIMSENLFFPLFLSSVYFLKKVLDEDNFKNNLLCGIFISLAFLTRILGLVLVGVYVIEKIYLGMIRKNE